jgi:hypothetical protein
MVPPLEVMGAVAVTAVIVPPPPAVLAEIAYSNCTGANTWRSC